MPKLNRSDFSFNTYNIIRLDNYQVIGSVSLPKRCYGLLEIRRSWANQSEGRVLNTLLVPSTGVMERWFQND